MLLQSQTVCISNINIDIPSWEYDQMHNMNIKQLTFCDLDYSSTKQACYADDKPIDIKV